MRAAVTAALVLLSAWSASASAECPAVAPGAEGDGQVLLLGAVADGAALVDLQPGTRVSAVLRDHPLRRDAYALGAALYRPGASPEAATPVEGQVSRAQLSALQLMLSRADNDACGSALVDRLAARHSLLRLPVAVDSVTRRRHPDRDVVLAPGDILVVPSRPSAVMVAGAVRAPGAVRFESGSAIEDYVREAGGWASGARRGQTIVYLPQGELRPLSAGIWNYQRENVPPGSIIVVPARGLSAADAVQGMLDARAPSTGRGVVSEADEHADARRR